MENIIEKINLIEDYRNVKKSFNQFVYYVYRYNLLKSKNDLLNNIKKNYGSKFKYSKDLFPNKSFSENYIFEKIFYDKYIVGYKENVKLKEKIKELENKKKCLLKNQIIISAVDKINKDIENLKKELYQYSFSYLINSYCEDYEIILSAKNTDDYEEDLDYFEELYFYKDNMFTQKYSKKIYEMCQLCDIKNIDKNISNIEKSIKKHSEYITYYKKLKKINEKLTDCENINGIEYEKFILKNINEISDIFYSQISDEVILQLNSFIENGYLQIMNIWLIPYTRFFSDYPDTDGGTFKYLFRNQNSITPSLKLLSNISKKEKEINFSELDEMLYINKFLN